MSLMAPKAIGSVCENETNYDAPFVKVIIQSQDLKTYGMLVYGMSIGEAENVAITPSIGNQLFVYCTNSAPVQIALKGVIGYKDGTPNKRFPEFYKEQRVGASGNILKLTIDGTSYRCILTSYHRDYATTPTVADNCSITFLGVRED